jgi:UDP-perosamine 4-acetyltransferase
MGGAHRTTGKGGKLGGRHCILVGAGGHAKVLVDCLRRQGVRILGFVDRDVRLHGKAVCGLPVLGGDAELARYAGRGLWLVNAVGSIRSLLRRKAVFESLKRKGHKFLTVVHPSAVLGNGVRLGEGAQVMAGVVIQPDAIIGENSIINTGARIDHDCAIGAHTHVAPGCVLSGNVRVGDETQLGTGAAVIQGVTVGSRCLVAAGAVVVRDVADGTSVMGVPAKPAHR